MSAFKCTTNAFSPMTIALNEAKGPIDLVRLHSLHRLHRRHDVSEVTVIKDPHGKILNLRSIENQLQGLRVWVQIIRVRRDIGLRTRIALQVNGSAGGSYYDHELRRHVKPPMDLNSSVYLLHYGGIGAVSPKFKTLDELRQYALDKRVPGISEYLTDKGW